MRQWIVTGVFLKRRGKISSRSLEESTYPPGIGEATMGLVAPAKAAGMGAGETMAGD